MIVHIDRSPFRPGQDRGLSVDGEGDEYEVDIMCFVRSPPPPGVRACRECGRIRLRRGEQAHIRASEDVFREADGFVRLLIQSNRGEKEQIDLEIRAAGGTHDPGSGHATTGVY